MGLRINVTDVAFHLFFNFFLFLDQDIWLVVRVAHLFWSSLTYIYTMLANNAINHLLPKSFKTKEITTYDVGTPDLCFDQAQIVAGLKQLMGFKSSPSFK
jgi:hypothetical protein